MSFRLLFFIGVGSQLLAGCVENQAERASLACEDSECNAPPQSGCIDNLAVSFSPSGRCEANECFYEQIQVSCGEGTKCLGGICVVEEDCLGIVCDEPPPATCNASVVVTYPGLGQCESGQCVYQPTFSPCDADQVCMNARCYDLEDPCATISCESPPQRGCDGNTVQVFGELGECVEGECIYPLTETECGDNATCVEGECDSTLDPCEGIECTTAPPRICAGNIVVIYGEIGVCEQGECRYPVFEEFCLPNELCSEGACQDPCVGVTCSEPPVSFCDGDNLHTFPAQGTCFLGECDYAETIAECGDGKICFEGACRFTPGVGDLIITEIMYDPFGADTGSEWFEVHNPTEKTLYIGGLSISDESSSSGNLTQLNIPEGVQIEAGAYVVFAQSFNALEGESSINIVDVSQWGSFSLNNTSDQLVLKYQDLVVDSVNYREDGAISFPVASGYSLSLEPDQDASMNDLGDRWCLGLSPYESNDPHYSPKGYGTPGAANPPCDLECLDVECAEASSFCEGGVANLLVFSDSCNLEECEGARYQKVDCTIVPPAICDENNTLTTYPVGSCLGAGICNYLSPTVENCGQDVCVDTGLPAGCYRAPKIGDLVITEYFARPDIENSLEWFEIYNASNKSLFLSEVIVHSGEGENGQYSLPHGHFVAPNSYFIFAASFDAVPGGADFVWPASSNFDLSPSSDSIRLEYLSETITSLDYSDCVGCFPYEDGKAVALDPSLYGPLANQEGSHWCISLGSPRAPNPPCFSCGEEDPCPDLGVGVAWTCESGACVVVP